MKSRKQALKEIKNCRWLFVEAVHRSPARKFRKITQYAILGFNDPYRNQELISRIEDVLMDARRGETGGQGERDRDSIDFVTASKNPLELGWEDDLKIDFLFESGCSVFTTMTMKEARGMFNFSELQ